MNRLNESNVAGDAIGSHALNSTESAVDKTQDVAESLEKGAANKNDIKTE